MVNINIEIPETCVPRIKDAYVKQLLDQGIIDSTNTEILQEIILECKNLIKTKVQQHELSVAYNTIIDSITPLEI